MFLQVELLKQDFGVKLEELKKITSSLKELLKLERLQKVKKVPSQLRQEELESTKTFIGPPTVLLENGFYYQTLSHKT